jgi:hypothetical protein
VQDQTQEGQWYKGCRWHFEEVQQSRRRQQQEQGDRRRRVSSDEDTFQKKHRKANRNPTQEEWRQARMVARSGLHFNRVRQAAVTQELLEIVSGASALESNQLLVLT